METGLSVLIYLDADDGKERCVRSILNDSGVSEDELQILLLDPSGYTAAEADVRQAGRPVGGLKQSMREDADGAWTEALQKEHPRSRIEYLSVSGMEMAQAYNEGLLRAEGELISFMLASSWFSDNALGRAVSHFEENGSDLISLRPEYHGTERQESNYMIAPASGGARNACDDPKNLQLQLHAYLIRRRLLEGLHFREELHEEAQNEMVLQLLMKSQGRFYYEDQAVYNYSVVLEDGAELTELAEQKWWYEASVRYFLLDFMKKARKKYEGAVPLYLQSAIYYLLCAKYNSNLSGRNKFMLNREEVQSFYDLCCDVLVMIDDDIIYQNDKFPGVKLPRALCVLFLEGKARKLGYQFVRTEEKNVIKGRCIAGDSGAVISETVLGNLKDEILNIQVINYREGRLEIDGFFQGAAFMEPESFELYGETEGKEPQRILAEKSEVYGLLKCFGVTYARKYGVHICVPVKDMVGKKFAVYVESGNSKNRLKLKFTSMGSRLLTNSQRAYWRFDHDQYILSRWDKYLLVTKSTPLTVLKKELMLDLVLLKQKERREAFTCVAVRLLYWLLRPYFRKKRIWITFDKLFKAGDNGEYFFQYCQKQDDGIDCYYVINRDAGDCGRLVKQHGKRILYANTWKCRFLALQAEAILATHAGTAVYLGFPVPYHKYFKNLYNADNICIQHGLSIQKIANFQNRLYANTKLYCCASPFERENISRPIYGYEPEMLKMTGLARYDGLKNKEQKQILITPTWRKGLVHTKGVGMKNDHSGHFKETAYYRIYNSLINDGRLIACAKEQGYRIIFLLHPAMSAQLEDYDQNGFVELVQAAGNMNYEKILTESSLMVTDYSGVQFDFAYQRKPLVYYHPEELPPHYDEGGLIYDTMGFGPICTNHEQIIETLCDYMRNGCRMTEEYIARADQFFAFDDFNNAQRIYEEVIKFERESRNAESE